jgi:hypothetical protein
MVTFSCGGQQARRLVGDLLNWRFSPGSAGIAHRIEMVTFSCGGQLARRVVSDLLNWRFSPGSWGIAQRLDRCSCRAA